MSALYQVHEGIRGFVAAGGPVLYCVGLLSFAMWTLVFERAWYFRFGLRRDVGHVVAAWEGRAERQSWHARQIRRAMLSRLRGRIRHNLRLIRACVTLCPLLGLLGTVTGMMVVFHALAVSGGADARSLLDGVARATIPTMAGMLAAVSGLFANAWVTRTANRELLRVEDRLTTDH